jgi:hypothetical protein
VSLILRNECRVWLFEVGVRRRIFVPERGSNSKMQCADSKINQPLMLWCWKLAMVEVHCVAEKAEYPLLPLVKDMQSDRWPFKSWIILHSTENT